jgi:hypothetical protein
MFEGIAVADEVQTEPATLGAPADHSQKWLAGM